MGERDWADDPKYAYYFEKGALTKKKRHNSGKGKKSEKVEGKPLKRTKRAADSDEEEEEGEPALEAEDEGAEWIEVVADEEGELDTKRLFRPASSQKYFHVEKGAF